MNNKLKFYFILFYSILFYFNNLLLSVVDFLIIAKYFYMVFLFLMVSIYIYLLYLSYISRNILTHILLKTFIFFIVMLIFFFIEQLFIYIFLHGLNGYGYLQKSGLVDFAHSLGEFTWQEMFYWHFIFSLHYPIYIFIFIKPFINHLDTSIKKTQKKNG